MDNPQRLVPTQKWWFWVTGKIDGQTTLLGAYATREEAENHGFDGFPDGNYKIHMLNTYSRPAARQQLGHEIFEETGDLKLSLQRFKHNLAK